MNKEDYFKYYIQGSDHYLIPKYEFIELFNEMGNWREEAKKLKKHLEENKNPLKGIFSQVNDDMLLRNCGAMQIEIDTYKNQQKEFIEYMNKTIEELECDDVDDEELKGYLIQRIDTFKEILSTYIACTIRRYNRRKRMNYPYKKGWWETKDHRKLKIEDMETSHIENPIKYLKKNKDFYDEGGGNTWDIDSWWYEDNSHLVDKKIEELENELSKRLKEKGE